MGFVTGLLLIDAPASALNNMGSEPGARTDNTIAVKRIQTPEGTYPYVSAQAVRFWIRRQLENAGGEWKAAPVFREGKVAYTDGDPLKHWDDDLFGYMRAPSKRKDAEKDARATPLEKDREITRISPFRVSTLVSTAPVKLVDDFGTMARQDSDPVPHEHQFYRAHLKGLVSLDLTCAGTFFDGERVGFKNLDKFRREEAQKLKLAEVEVRGQKALRLPAEVRAQRAATLIAALGDLNGGAKQTLHYTDVNPAVAVFAVTKGGNHPFQRLFTGGRDGRTELRLDALEETLRIYKSDFLSPLHVGWATGFLDEERTRLAEFAKAWSGQPSIVVQHPREAAKAVADALKENHPWFD